MPTATVLFLVGPNTTGAKVYAKSQIWSNIIITIVFSLFIFIGDSALTLTPESLFNPVHDVICDDFEFVVVVVVD